MLSYNKDSFTYCLFRLDAGYRHKDRHAQRGDDVNTGTIPSTIRGMPEATRSLQEKHEQFFPDSPGKEPILLMPWFHTSRLQKWDNKFLLRHPACGTLFWQPQETNILYQLEEVICNCSLLKDLSRMDSRFWQLSVLYLSNWAYGFLCVLLICLTSIGLIVLISIVNQILYS